MAFSPLMQRHAPKDKPATVQGWTSSASEPAGQNSPMQDILACRCCCSYTMSLACPHLESDPSSRWVPRHLACQACVDEHLTLLPRLPEDPFGELRQTTMASQHAAKRVLRLPSSMHKATRPSWLCNRRF